MLLSVVLSGMMKNTNIYLHCEQHLEESQVPSTLLHFDHPCLRIHRLSAESSHLYMDQTLSLILITDQISILIVTAKNFSFSFSQLDIMEKCYNNYLFLDFLPIKFLFITSPAFLISFFFILDDSKYILDIAAISCNSGCERFLLCYGKLISIWFLELPYKDYQNTNSTLKW